MCCLLAGVDEAVDAVKRAYQAFDASGKGHVSAHDIFRVMEEQVIPTKNFPRFYTQLCIVLCTDAWDT
jgi:hypothetical protein